MVAICDLGPHGVLGVYTAWVLELLPLAGVLVALGWPFSLAMLAPTQYLSNALSISLKVSSRELILEFELVTLVVVPVGLFSADRNSWLSSSSLEGYVTRLVVSFGLSPGLAQPPNEILSMVLLRSLMAWSSSSLSCVIHRITYLCLLSVGAVTSLCLLSGSTGSIGDVLSSSLRLPSLGFGVNSILFLLSVITI